MAENTIDNLSIEVTASADKAARAFDRLVSSADKLRVAAQGAAGGMQNMAHGAKDAGTAAETAGTRIRSTGNAAKDAGDKAKKGSAGIATFWNALKRLGNISLKGIKSALFDLPKFFGGKLLSNVKQAVAGVGQFFNSIKRIAFYRAIRSALKLITQGFSEGMQNLYAWSAAVNGSFAASMDRLASASLYLKNSMAAMVSPLVEAIAPAVDFVIDKFVDLFNVINQVFALLAGKVSYTAANKVSAQWKAASNSASGSAKKAADEIKRTLLGFDEINKLNDNNKSSGSGGGGGGGSTGSGALGFEERPISDWIQNMFDSGNFSALGTLVAEKINTALNNISWETIRAKSFKFVDSITSLLNGFIKEIDGTLLGKSFAEAINTAVASINRFWDKTKWAEAGKKLHDAIVAFFADIDVVGAANALTAKFKSIVTLIGNALPQSQEEWNVIGKKISTFISTAISNISTSGIGEVIGNLISGALTTITILANDSTLTKIANGIKKNIEDACKKITPQQVSQFVNAVLRDVMSAIGVLFSIDLQFGDITISPVAVAAFALAAGPLIKGALSNAFGSIFGNVSPTGLGKGLAFTAGVALAIQAVVDLVDVVNGIQDGNVDWSKIGGILRNALMSTGMFLLATGHYPAGLIAIGVGLVIEPVVVKIADFINDYGPILKGAGEMGWQSFKDGWNSMSMEALKIPVQLALTAQELWAGLQIGWLIVQNKVLEIGVAIAETAQDIWDGISNGWNALANKSLEIAVGISTTVAELWNQIVEWWDEFTSGKWLGIHIGIGDGSGKVDTSSSDAYDSGAWAHATSINVGVNGIAGKLMKVVGGKLAPDTTNTNTTNTVKGGVGAGMKSISGKFAPIVSNTSTTNTVKAAAGAGVKASGKSYVVSMANTKTSNEVYAVPGVGMVKLSGTNSYSIKAVDTKTKDTVSGASGAGMYYDKNAKAFKPYVAGTTTKNTINGSSGTGMGYDKNNGKFKPKVENTSSTVSVKKGWTGKVLDKLGLSDLKATIKVGLTVDKKKSKAVLTGTTGNVYNVNVRGEKAKGGIFSNGIWSNIPQYAGGTANAHGSMFLAGEAGPEIVGHVGGRTEVLNKSQLASAMFSAVQAAMAPAAANFAAAASNMSAASVGVDLETLAEMVRQGVEQAMSRSNDYDRQKVELLRSINEKDSTVEVSTSSINRAQTRMNRRAGTTIVAVGT